MSTCRDLHGLVQLLENAQDAENNAGNGRWRVQDALINGRPVREDGGRSAEAGQARPLQKARHRKRRLTAGTIPPRGC